MRQGVDAGAYVGGLTGESERVGIQHRLSLRIMSVSAAGGGDGARGQDQSCRSGSRGSIRGQRRDGNKGGVHGMCRINRFRPGETGPVAEGFDVNAILLSVTGFWQAALLPA